MKVVIAATPLTGHVNPMLAVARLLAARGDSVTVISAEPFRAKIEGGGFRFVPYEDDGAASYLEPQLVPGPERWRHEFQRRFVDPISAQFAVLRTLIEEERPDVIVAGSMFLGVLPLLLSDRPRPPIVVLNVSFLFVDRLDQAPVGLGLPPARDAATASRYAELKAGMDTAFVEPVRAYTDSVLARVDAKPLPASLTQSIATLPDLFLQPSVPSFEYDDGATLENLRFIGLMPLTPSVIALPDWWDELESGKPVVLVTQGTLANADFGELIEPTLEALADRDDLLVVATTGGRPVESLRGPVPANARMARFLPFDRLLPKVRVLVTNGGYGSVSQALSVGVPIVGAGLTEDKAEVNARVGWSGAGVNLAANTPTVEALRHAIGEVLDDPRFRENATRIARDFAARDAGHEILTAIDGLVEAKSPSRRSA